MAKFEHHQFCRVTYWNGYTAASKDDDWTVCKVEPVSSYSSYGTQEFSRDQLYQRDALIYLLSQAFDLGRKDKAREIKRVLEL